MKIINKNCEYIEVQSSILADIVNDIGNYNRLVIEGSVNCCSEKFQAEVEFELYNNNTCTTCNNTYIWSFDLTDIANSSQVISEILVKNILTGEEYNVLSGNVNFTTYLSTCPNGSCTIQSIPSYGTNFNNDVDNWFTTNVGWSNAKATICGNVLQICNIAPNFILSSIKYTDGTSTEQDYFNFGNQNTSFIIGESLYIKPQFFNLPSIMDGVYKIKLIATSTRGSWVSDENCGFIDCETKCKVATYVDKILSEDKETKDEAINITMTHYALINASNCGCNCKELCDLYFSLYESVNNKKVVNECNC